MQSPTCLLSSLILLRVPAVPFYLHLRQLQHRSWHLVIVFVRNGRIEEDTISRFNLVDGSLRRHVPPSQWEAERLHAITSFPMLLLAVAWA